MFGTRTCAATWSRHSRPDCLAACHTARGVFSAGFFFAPHPADIIRGPTGRDGRAVEGARLESVYGSKAHRGFESHSLRQVNGPVMGPFAFSVAQRGKTCR